MDSTYVGTSIGAGIGLIKSFLIGLLTLLTPAAIFETAVLTAIGASIGWLVTELLKGLKKKFSKTNK